MLVCWSFVVQRFLFPILLAVMYGMIRVEASQVGETWKKLIFSKVMAYQSAHPREVKCEIIDGTLTKIYFLGN